MEIPFTNLVILYIIVGCIVWFIASLRAYRRSNDVYEIVFMLGVGIVWPIAVICTLMYGLVGFVSNMMDERQHRRFTDYE